MTPKGEETTLKGELTGYGFSSSKDLSISFSENKASFFSLFEGMNTEVSENSQMIFVLKGRLKGYVETSKKAMFLFDDQQHNLLAGKERLTWSVDPNHDIVCVNISFAFLSRYLPLDHSGYLNLKSGLTDEKPAAFSRNNLHITPEINAILNTLKTSPHTGFCANLFLESKVLELLMLQASQYEQLKESDTISQLKKEELNRMQKVKEILMENIDSQFSLRTLAHMVGTNEFNLKRNFKIAFGTTVYGYLNQYKMERAKTMLIENDITIAELSAKMGYKYATHFTSAFKKYFGYLPNKLKSVIWALSTLAGEFGISLEAFQPSFITY